MKPNEFKNCDMCKMYHWSHSDCDPVYLVYHEDHMGDEPKEMRASSHKEAALSYARYYNEDDYPLMDGETIKVKVEFEGEIKYFELGAEPDIHYSSNEIDSL